LKNILIINDSPLFIKRIGRILESGGYGVISAENGRLGLEALQQQKPDCILLDIIMPEMDGVEFLRTGTAQKMNVPVVVLSSDPDHPDRVKALKELGVKDIIVVTPERGALEKKLLFVLEKLFGKG
jgi:CheY-like chemotaxis protein